MGRITINLETRYILHYLDRLRIGMCARVVGVQAVDIRHEKQIIRINHSCSDGGQCVVISEFDFL